MARPGQSAGQVAEQLFGVLIARDGAPVCVTQHGRIGDERHHRAEQIGRGRPQLGRLPYAGNLDRSLVDFVLSQISPHVDS